MANNLMGYIDGEFIFEVKDGYSATRRTSKGDTDAIDSLQWKKRWANKAFKKLPRDKSA